MKRVKKEFIGDFVTNQKTKHRVQIEDTKECVKLLEALGLTMMLEDKPRKGKKMEFPKHEAEDNTEEVAND